MGVASGAKGFTALTVMRLVEDGLLTLDTRARELLRDDLPLVDDRVTIEQLLAHRSGIGDYLDESEAARPRRLPDAGAGAPARHGRVLPRGARRLPAGVRARHRLRLLQRRVRRARAARRAGLGLPFHDLVQRHVIDRAGLSRTAYLRSDALPGDAALGYLAEGRRTSCAPTSCTCRSSGVVTEASSRPPPTW